MSLRSGIGSGSGHSKLQSHLDSAASPIFLQALQPQQQQQQQHSTFYRVPELNMMGLIDSSAVDACAAAAGDATGSASGSGTVLKLELSHADQVELDLNMMLNQQAVAAAAAAVTTPSYWPAPPQGPQHPQHHLILPQESLGCLYTSAAAAASAASAAAACVPPSSGSASDCGNGNGNGSSSLVFPLAAYCNRTALDGGGHGEATMFPYKHQQGRHGLQQQDAACAASGSSSSSSYLHYNHLPYKTMAMSGSSSATTNSPQLQALRDFMSYGSSLQQQQQPSCSSPGPGPGPGPPRLRGLNSATLFLQLGEEQECHGQLEQEAAERELQNQATTAPTQDAMASYRALCQSEMLAAAAASAGAQLVRSPHRSQFQRENHIMAERQRREEMNEKFTALRSMIPKATKKDKASIVGDTINYVLELEKTLKHLQACKAARKGPLPLPMLSSGSAVKQATSTPSNTAFPNEQQQQQSQAEAESLDQANVTMCAAGSDHDTVLPYHQHQASLAGPPHQAASAAAAAAAAEEPAQVEVQKLRDQAVIKIICSRSPGLVFRILHALDECKVDLLQGNVTTVDDNTVHFITVQLVAGSSASTEDLVVALQNASTAIG